MMTPAYLKIAAVVILLGTFFMGGFHFGGLGPTAALERDHAAMAKATTDALLAQRAAAEAQAINDHAAETTHANDIRAIDNASPRTDPVLVYRTVKACVDPVPGAEAQAGGVATHPAEGRSESVDRGRDIRPAIEEVKRRLEKVMADYRQEDSEWPK